LALDSYRNENLLAFLIILTSIPIVQLLDYHDFSGIEGFFPLAEQLTKDYD
jgi:hypothetical protein